MGAAVRFKQRCLILGLTTVAAPLVVVAAPSALAAECVEAGGVTVCGQGAVRSDEPVAGPVVPFDCPYEWYCANFGLDSQLDGPPPARPPSEFRPPQP
jgi:hypothetical protein